MNSRPSPSLFRVKELLSYSPATGDFHWRVDRGGVRAGSIAGCLDGKGHWHIGIDYKRCLAHRLAWLISFGTYPNGEIDHINGVRSDNRLENLRVVSRSENMQNTTHSRGPSGLRGVGWHKATRKWRARVVVAGAEAYVGWFDSERDAYSAYLAAREKFHPAAARALPGIRSYGK